MRFHRVAVIIMSMAFCKLKLKTYRRISFAVNGKTKMFTQSETAALAVTGTRIARIDRQGKVVPSIGATSACTNMIIEIVVMALKVGNSARIQPAQKAALLNKAN